MSYLYFAKVAAAALAAGSDTHRGTPSPNPLMCRELRYEMASRPPGASNLHGEIERLQGSDVDVTHWFVEAAGVTFHLATAGDHRDEAVLFVHGLPESWYAWHHQIADLASDYYVIAIDMKGYGQSDKRLDLDYRTPTQAREVAELIDVLGIDRFNMVSHDRGVVLTDHLAAVPGMEGRILRYVRMQQSASEPHGKPEPPHRLFGSWLGVRLFRSEVFPRVVFDHRGYCSVPLSEEELDRINYEAKYKGIAEAVSKYFRTTNFAQELEERHGGLFAKMTMPVLFLQGRYDPGQHPEEYDHVCDFVREGYVQMVDAGHFLHREKPEVVSQAIRWLLAKPTSYAALAS